jgi:hypothetical protein
LLIDLADLDRAPTRLEQWQTDLKSYSNELVLLLVNALPDYRSRAIAEQMFKIAIYKAMYKPEKGNAA